MFFGINLNNIRKAKRTINTIISDLYALKAVYLSKCKSNVTQSAHVYWNSSIKSLAVSLRVSLLVGIFMNLSPTTKTGAKNSCSCFWMAQLLNGQHQDSKQFSAIEMQELQKIAKLGILKWKGEFFACF